MLCVYMYIDLKVNSFLPRITLQYPRIIVKTKVESPVESTTRELQDVSLENIACN